LKAIRRAHDRIVEDEFRAVDAQARTERAKLHYQPGAIAKPVLNLDAILRHPPHYDAE
jgi:hypothetical protein